MDDTRSVSETIGIVVLVALAVLMAGITLLFVLGVFDSPGRGGRVTAEFDASRVGDNIVVEHRGGKRIRRTSLVVVLQNETRRAAYDLANPLDLAVPLGDGDAYFEPGEAAVLSDPPTGTVAVQLVHQPRQRILLTTTLRVPVGPSRVNQPPVAVFTVKQTRTSGTILDASQSRDPDGTIRSFEWDVGNDGDIDYTGRIVENARVPRGTRVALIVTDDDGAMDTAVKVVGGPPDGTRSLVAEPLQNVSAGPAHSSP